MKEVNPKETTRAYAFEMWMDAPMPMLTFFKTMDVTRLAHISKRTGLKFNMLVYRKGGKQHQRVLYAACWQEIDAIRQSCRLHHCSQSGG